VKVNHIPDDARRGDLGSDLHRRFVIDKIAINDGFTIAVGKDRRTEDLRGVQGWRSGKADLHRIEVVEHAEECGIRVVGKVPLCEHAQAQELCVVLLQVGKVAGEKRWLVHLLDLMFWRCDVRRGM